MGASWSSANRRRNNYNYYHHQNPNPPPSHLISSSFASSSTSNSNYRPDPSTAHRPYPYPPHPPPPPPPPPPASYSYFYSGGYNGCNYPNQPPVRTNFNPYYNYHGHGWSGARQPPVMGPPQPPPRYVDHQQAKKVRNDVNVHKDTIRLEVDEQSPDQHLVSFVYDALVDGSFTVFYFAKEESNCSFAPLFTGAYMPVKFPFKKGVRQKFRQPSGTGIDLGFFEVDDLSKPSLDEDVFPLVIAAEASLPSLLEEDLHDGPATSFPHMQITQAVIQKNDENDFLVKVIRQILWIDGVRYELREIYGIGTSAAESFKDDDLGKECVICMTEPKNTAVIPCRHMCMCSECAKELRLQSNKCPICRQPIEELLEIKINNCR